MRTHPWGSGDHRSLARRMPKRQAAAKQAFSAKPVDERREILAEARVAITGTRRRRSGWTASSGSVGADVVVADDLAPARHLGEQKLLRRLGARGDDVHPERLGEDLADVGQPDRLRELAVELLHDRLRRARGRDD